MMRVLERSNPAAALRNVTFIAAPSSFWSGCTSSSRRSASTDD
jgi:hypothetical protein